jgi:pantoate--beta-alanine ligase
MYPTGFQTQVTVGALSRPLCGIFRPGHFDGVATVVAKLFQIVQPTRAYFGLKDYQQWLIIQRMAQDLDWPLKVVGCPTVREPDELALSSRNRYLTFLERERAAGFSAALRFVEELIKSRSYGAPEKILAQARATLRRIPGLRIQYLSLVDPQTLQPLTRVQLPALIAGAIYLGRTRLIDNRLIR